MARFNSNSQNQEKPEDLVQTFAAASNFPKERAGVLALAQALKRASEDYRIPMSEIVQQCSDISAYCPTPHNIRSIAIGMRETIDGRHRGSKHADWERLYGPPQSDWSNDLIGVMADDSPKVKLRALHIRAVRDTLHYTEGEGREMGDRQFWKEAAEANISKYGDLVEQVRSAGGWQTELELQMDWVDIPWQVPDKPKKFSFKREVERVRG